MSKNNMLTVESRDTVCVDTSVLRDFQEAMCAGQEELLRQIVRVLRTIRFGSIMITLHDGQIAEVQKTSEFEETETRRILVAGVMDTRTFVALRAS